MTFLLNIMCYFYWAHELMDEINDILYEKNFEH